MDRRTMLRTAGGGLVVSLAGCLTRTDRDDSTAELSVTEIGVYKAVTYESTMGSGGVLAPEDRQFVVEFGSLDRLDRKHRLLTPIGHRKRGPEQRQGNQER